MSREPLTNKATLYRVHRKVRPLPGHPLFWKCQFGLLNVWLYADTPESAGYTADDIIALLPYERVGTQLAVNVVAKEKSKVSGGQSDETREQMDLREQLAAESGLSMMLIVIAVGADEADEAEFEDWPLG